VFDVERGFSHMNSGLRVPRGESWSELVVTAEGGRGKGFGSMGHEGKACLTYRLLYRSF